MSSRSSSPCKRPPQNRNALVLSKTSSHESIPIDSTSDDSSCLNTQGILPKSSLNECKKQKKETDNLGNEASGMIKKLLMKKKRKEKELIKIKLKDNRIPKVSLVRLHLANLQSKLSSHSILETEKEKDLIQSKPKLANKKGDHHSRPNHVEGNDAHKSQPKREIEKTDSNQSLPKLDEKKGGVQLKCKPGSEEKISRVQPKLSDIGKGLVLPKLSVETKKDRQSHSKTETETQDVPRFKLRQQHKQNGVCPPQIGHQHTTENDRTQSKVDDENARLQRSKLRQQDKQNDVCPPQIGHQHTTENDRTQSKVDDENARLQRSKLRQQDKQNDVCLSGSLLGFKKKDDSQPKIEDKIVNLQPSKSKQIKHRDDLDQPSLEQKTKNDPPHSKIEEKPEGKKKKDLLLLKIDGELGKKKADQSQSKVEEKLERRQNRNQSQTDMRRELKDKKKDAQSQLQVEKMFKLRKVLPQSQTEPESNKNTQLKPKLDVKEQESCNPELELDGKNSNHQSDSKDECTKKRSDNCLAKLANENRNDQSHPKLLDRRKDRRQSQSDEHEADSHFKTNLENKKEGQSQSHAAATAPDASHHDLCDIGRKVQPTQLHKLNVPSKLDPKILNFTPVVVLEKSQIGELVKKAPVHQAPSLGSADPEVIVEQPAVEVIVDCEKNSCAKKVFVESDNSSSNLVEGTKKSSVNSSGRKSPRILIKKSIDIKLPENSLVKNPDSVPQLIEKTSVDKSRTESSTNPAASCTKLVQNFSVENSGKVALNENNRGVDQIPVEKNAEEPSKIAEKIGIKYPQNSSDKGSQKVSLNIGHCKIDEKYSEISGNTKEKDVEPSKKETKSKSIQHSKEKIEKPLDISVEENSRLRRRVVDKNFSKSVADGGLMLNEKSKVENESANLDSNNSLVEKISDKARHVQGDGPESRPADQSQKIPIQKLGKKAKHSSTNKTGEIASEKNGTIESFHKHGKQLSSKLEVSGVTKVISNDNPSDEKRIEILGDDKEKSSLPPKKESKTKKLACVMRSSQDILDNVVDEFLRPRKNNGNAKNIETSGYSSEKVLSEKLPRNKLHELPNKVTENQKDQLKSLSSSCKKPSHKINNFSEVEAANTSTDEPTDSIQKKAFKGLGLKTHESSLKTDHTPEVVTIDSNIDFADSTQKKVSKSRKEKTKESLNVESKAVPTIESSATNKLCDNGNENSSISLENLDASPVELSRSKILTNRLKIPEKSKEKSSISVKENETIRKPVDTASIKKMKLVQNIPEKSSRPKRNLIVKNSQAVIDSLSENIPEKLEKSNSEHGKLNDGEKIQTNSAISNCEISQDHPVRVEKLAEKEVVDIEIEVSGKRSHKKSTSKLQKRMNDCNIVETCVAEVLSNNSNSINEEITDSSHSDKFDKNIVASDQTNDGRRFTRNAYNRSVKNAGTKQENGSTVVQRSEMKNHVTSENVSKSVECSDHSAGKDVEKSTESTEKCVIDKSVTGEKSTDISKILDEVVNVSDESTQPSVTDCNKPFSDDLKLRKKRPRQTLCDETIEKSDKTPKIAQSDESHSSNKPLKLDHEVKTKTSEIGNQRPKRRVIRKSSDCCSDHSSDSTSGNDDVVGKSNEAPSMDTQPNVNETSFPIKIGKRSRRSSARGNYAESLNQVDKSLEENSLDSGPPNDSSEVPQGYGTRGRRKSVSTSNTKILRKSISIASLCPLPTDPEEPPQRRTTRAIYNKKEAKSTTDISVQDDPQTIVNCEEGSTKPSKNRMNCKAGGKRSQSTSRIRKTHDVDEFAQSTPDLSTIVSNGEEIEVSEKSKRKIEPVLCEEVSSRQDYPVGRRRSQSSSRIRENHDVGDLTQSTPDLSTVTSSEAKLGIAGKVRKNAKSKEVNSEEVSVENDYSANERRSRSTSRIHKNHDADDFVQSTPDLSTKTSDVKEIDPTEKSKKNAKCKTKIRTGEVRKMTRNLSKTDSLITPQEIETTIAPMTDTVTDQPSLSKNEIVVSVPPAQKLAKPAMGGIEDISIIEQAATDVSPEKSEIPSRRVYRKRSKSVSSASTFTVTRSSLRRVNKDQNTPEIDLTDADNVSKTDESLPPLQHSNLRRSKSRPELSAVKRRPSIHDHEEPIVSELTKTRESRKTEVAEEQTESPAKVTSRRSRSITRVSDKISSHPKYKSRSVSRYQNTADDQAVSVPNEAGSRKRSKAIVTEVPMIDNQDRISTRKRAKSCSEREKSADDPLEVAVSTEGNLTVTTREYRSARLKRVPRKLSLDDSEGRILYAFKDSNNESLSTGDMLAVTRKKDVAKSNLPASLGESTKMNQTFVNGVLVVKKPRGRPRKNAELPSEIKKAKLDIHAGENQTLCTSVGSIINNLVEQNHQANVIKDVYQAEAEKNQVSSEASVLKGALDPLNVVPRKRSRGRPRKIVQPPSELEKANINPSEEKTVEVAKQNNQPLITQDIQRPESEFDGVSTQVSVHEGQSSVSKRVSLRSVRRPSHRRDKTPKEPGNDIDCKEKSVEENEILSSDCLMSFLAFYHGESNDNIRLSLSDDCGSPEKNPADSGSTDEDTVNTEYSSEMDIENLNQVDELLEVPKQVLQKTPKKKKLNTGVDTDNVSKLVNDIPVRCSRRIAQRKAEKKKDDEPAESVEVTIEETPMSAENLTPSAEDVEVQQSLAGSVQVEMEKTAEMTRASSDEIYESIEPICMVPSDTPVEMMDQPIEDQREPSPPTNEMEHQDGNISSVLDEILKSYAEENSAESSANVSSQEMMVENMIEGQSQGYETRDPLSNPTNDPSPIEGMAQESSKELGESPQLSALISDTLVFGNFLIENTDRSPIRTPDHMPVHLNPHSLPAEVDMTSEISQHALSELPNPADFLSGIESTIPVDSCAFAENPEVGTNHPARMDEVVDAIPSTVIEASTEPRVTSVLEPPVETDSPHVEQESTEENRLASPAEDDVAPDEPGDVVSAADSSFSTTGDDAEKLVIADDEEGYEPNSVSETNIEDQVSPWQGSEDTPTNQEKEISENLDNAAMSQVQETSVPASKHTRSSQPENSSEADKSSAYDSCVENASEENYHSLSEDVDSDENPADKLNRLNKLQVTPLNSFDSPDSGVQDTMEEQPRPLASKYQRSSFKEMNAKVACKYCDESFVSSRDLNKHLRNQHRIVMKITKTDTNKHVTQMVERSSKRKPSRQLEDEAYVEEEEDDEEAEEEEDDDDEDEVLTSIEEVSGKITDGEIKMIVAKESGSKNSHVVKEIKITPKTADGNRSARSLSFSPIRSEITIKRRSSRARKYPIFTESELIAKQLAAASSATSCAPSFPATPALFNGGAILSEPLDKDDLFPAPESVTVQPDIVLDNQLNVTLRKIPAPAEEEKQPVLEGLAQRISEAVESDSSMSSGRRSRRHSTRSSLCDDEQLHQPAEQHEMAIISKCPRRLSTRSSIDEQQQQQLDQVTASLNKRLRRSSRRGSLCEIEQPPQQQQAAVVEKPPRRLSRRRSVCEDEQPLQEQETVPVDKRPRRLSTRISLSENEQLQLDQVSAKIDECLVRPSTRTSVCEHEQPQLNQESAKIDERPKRRMSTRNSICEDEQSEQQEEAAGTEGLPGRLSTRTSICEDDQPEQLAAEAIEERPRRESQPITHQRETNEECLRPQPPSISDCENELPQQQGIAESSEVPETAVREDKRRRESETDSAPLDCEARAIEEQPVIHEDKRPRLESEQHLDQPMEHEPSQELTDESNESPNSLLAKYNITRELVVPLTRVSESCLDSTSSEAGEGCSGSSHPSFSEIETTTTSLDTSLESNNNTLDKEVEDNDIIEIPCPQPVMNERREVATTTEHVVRTKVTTSVQTVDPQQPLQPPHQLQMQRPLLTLPPQLPEAMSSLVLAAAANAGIDGATTNILLNSLDSQPLTPLPHAMLQQHQFYVVYIPDNAAEGPSATLLNFQPVPDEMMNKSNVSFSITTGNATTTTPTSNAANVVAPNVASPTKIVTNNAATGNNGASANEELNKSFVCASCAEVSDLVGRLEASHGMTEEDKNIECPYCSNHFQSLVYLEYHVRQEHVKCQNEAQCRHSGLNSLRIPNHEAASEFEMYITFALKCRSCYDIFHTVALLNDHVMRKHSNLVRRSPSAMAAAAAAGITSPFMYPLQNGARSVLQCPSDCICRVGIRGNLTPLQRQQMIRRCPNAMRRLEKVEAAAYEVYTCNLCKSTFLMKDEVVEHLMKMHDVPCKFPCYKCLVSFRSPQLQERHRCSETTLRELDKLFYIAILPSNVSGKDETSPTATATVTSSTPVMKQISTPIAASKANEQPTQHPVTRFNGGKKRLSVEMSEDDEMSLLNKKFKYHGKPDPNKPDGRQARHRNCGKLMCSKRFYYLKSLQDHYVQEHIAAKVGHDETLRKKAAELLKILRSGREDSRMIELVNLLVRYEDPEDQLLFSNLMLNGQEMETDHETLEAIRSIEQMPIEIEPEQDAPCVKCKLRVNLSNRSGTNSSFVDFSDSRMCQCHEVSGLRTRSRIHGVATANYPAQNQQHLPQAQRMQSPPAQTQQPPSTPQKSPAQAEALKESPTSSRPPTFQPRPRRRARLMEPFACNRCPKSFRKGPELTAHRLEVHKIGHYATRLYVCELCLMKFFTAELLKKHRAYKHEDVVFDEPKSLLDAVEQEPASLNSSVNVSNQSVTEPELSEIDDEEVDGAEFETEEEPTVELDPSSGLITTTSATATLDDSSKEANDSLNVTVTSTDGDNGSSTCARRDSSDSSTGPKETEPQALCSLCAEVCSSKVSLKNHLKREHGCRASICQFCNSLLIETSEVRHMLDHHIVRSKSEATGGPGIGNNILNSSLDLSNLSDDACEARRETDELVRTLGLHRLQSLMIYHDFEGKCNNAIMRCPICPEMFATRESCRFHYIWHHDDTCVLCDEGFRSGSSACQHKVSAHTSTASYLWCMQRLVTGIVESLRLNPNQPSPLLYQELLARLGQEDQPPMLLVGRSPEVAGGSVGVKPSPMMSSESATEKTSASEQVVGAAAQPTFLEEVVLSEDQLPDSGNMIEVVIGKDDSEDDLLSMLNLSPSYPSRDEPNYGSLPKGVGPTEDEDDEDSNSASVPCDNSVATAPSVPSVVAESVALTSSSPVLPSPLSTDPTSAAVDTILPQVPTTPTHQQVVQVMPASTPPSAGTMGSATFSPGENYVCSGVCRYKLDNGEEQLVLVVTDDDLVTYRNDIGSLATRISATCDSLTLDEITEMLKAYFEGVGMGATTNPQ